MTSRPLRSWLAVACCAACLMLPSWGSAQKLELQHVPEPPGREPHHVRMLLETTVFMLLGTAWYFSGQDLNSEDWDLTPTVDDMRLKFLTLTQVRFDNNSFLFNQAFHPLAYAGIYLVARSNNMGPWTSFAYAFFSSLLWEYVGELREKVSINDQIVSPLTGMAWGEVGYSWGEYFNSPESDGKIARKVLTGVFGLPRLFHDWIDDADRYDPPQRRFYFEPVARLSMAARGLEADEPAEITTLAELDARMAVMPGYGTPGDSRTWFDDGNFTELQSEMRFGADTFDLDFDANSTIAGIYRKHIGPRGNGWDLMVGGGRGYRIVSRQGDQTPDRLGLVHLIGPNVWFRAFGPGQLRIETRLWGYFDFVTIQSLAVPDFVSKYGDEVLETIRTDTKQHSYYFGLGFTFSPSLHIHYGRYSLELDTELVRVHSIQGLDRFQEDVTRTILLDDLWWDSNARLVLPLPPDWLYIQLQGRMVQRASRLDEIRTEQVLKEARMGLEARF